mgnify:CR=1 FL=1
MPNTTDRIINPMALWARPMSDADMWRLIEAAADLEQVAKRLLKEHADGEYTIGLIEDAQAAIARTRFNP